MAVTPARKTTGRVWAVLCLLLSSTKMVAVAQDATLSANSSNNAAQDKMIANLLGNVFTGIALDVDKAISSKDLNATTHGTASSASSADKLDMSKIPNLARIIHLTANNSGPQVADALKSMLAQQQQAGGIAPIENAASTIAAFLNLPNTFGTGQNIQLFLTRVQELRDLRDTVRSYLNADQIRTIDSALIAAAQLGLQCATVPLAYLAFVVALVALAAAITGLLGGIFYCVGSALAVAATITGAPQPNAPATVDTTDVEELVAAAADARTSNPETVDVPLTDDSGSSDLTVNGVDSVAKANESGAQAVADEKWFQDLKAKAYKVQEPFIRLAFSQKAGAPINTALNMLNYVDDAMGWLGRVVSIPPGPPGPPNYK